MANINFNMVLLKDLRNLVPESSTILMKMKTRDSEIDFEAKSRV